MDQKKKEEIEKEAKKILDSFSKSLAKVEFKEKKGKEGLGGFREEGEGMKGDEDFRERMFANAPEKEGTYILSEKKKW